MSTKATIVYGHSYHLYKECFEDDGVYLELTNPEFSVDAGVVTVKIPIAVWETIRQKPGISLQGADKTDEEIEAEVRKDVRERIEACRKAVEKTGRPGIMAAMGVVVYGAWNDPEHLQVERGVADRKEDRDLLKTVREQIIAEKAAAKGPKPQGRNWEALMLAFVLAILLCVLAGQVIGLVR